MAKLVLMIRSKISQDLI